ncbi:MAG: T9SS type A sorting domain-containing protein [Bacteroidota bacterium]
MGFSQAQRMVLIEEFTNASCPPCAAQNPDFNALIHSTENTGRVVALKYQTAFPGFDPMNQQNPDEVDTRLRYYPGISGVPTAVIDGVIPDNDYAAGLGDWNITPDGGYAGGPYGYNNAVISFAWAQTTPIELDLDHNISDELDSVSISVKVTNVSATPFDLSEGVLHVAIFEKHIMFPTPPGSTNEVDFEDVMRKMVPDVGGTALADAIAPGDSVEWNFNVALPDYFYNFADIGVVAFVQDNMDKQVYQAARSDVKPLVGDFADVSLASNTTPPAGLCDATMTPSLTINNEGTSEITTFTASYTINDGTPVEETWTGSLMPGNNIAYDFAQITAPGGNINLDYRIVSVNGAIDINTLNNILTTETYATLSSDPIGTELSSDLESNVLFDYPTDAIAQIPIAEGGFGWGTFTVIDGTHPFADFQGVTFGAYGSSQRAIWLNYWQWNPGEAAAEDEGNLIYDKIDLTNSENTMLTFDRAGAQYNAPLSNDRLQMLISTDCGDTWTVVHDIAGADFATTAPNPNLYVPAAGDWVTDTVDLSAYDGVAEVNLQVKAISDWGNMHFLDNINIAGNMIVSTNALNKLEGNVEVFPNPTNSVANIEFQLEENAVVDVQVFDVTGKLVETVVYQREFVAGTHIATWRGAQERGIYLVKISTENGEVTKKLTVF